MRVSLCGMIFPELLLVALFPHNLSLDGSFCIILGLILFSHYLENFILVIRGRDEEFEDVLPFRSI
jgi:hypothetical protein